MSRSVGRSTTRTTVLPSSLKTNRTRTPFLFGIQVLGSLFSSVVGNTPGALSDLTRPVVVFGFQSADLLKWEVRDTSGPSTNRLPFAFSLRC